jgi:hypothetical protein
VRATVRIRTRDRWLAALAVLAFLLVCFAATAGRTHQRPPTTTVTLVPNSQARTVSADPTDDLHGVPPSHHYHFWTPPWRLLRDLTVLLAAVGLLLLIWLIVRWLPGLSMSRALRRAGSEHEAIADAVPDQVADVSRALTEALVAIELGDANRAIVACWIRLEQIAEEVGFARQPWETSTDLVTRWLGLASVPAEPLAELAELYREARYSGHAMSPASVEQARATLTRLRRAFVLDEPRARRASNDEPLARRPGNDEPAPVDRGRPDG